MTIQSVAIVGAGAMGALYASHFAGTGFDVTFVASGKRADRLASEGVFVGGQRIDATVYDASQDSAQPADLVLFSVKTMHLDSAIEDAAGVVGAQTLILSVLNGLESEPKLIERFGQDKVLYCVAAGMDAKRDRNQASYSQAGTLLFGEQTNDPDSPTERVVRLREALDRAGLAWRNPADMRHELWWKFMANTGINQASAVMRLPYGPFQTDGAPRSLMNALMAEVLRVSEAEGVGLNDSDVARWHEVLAGMPYDGWTSMRQDVEAGRETEVDSFAGHMVRLGEKHKIQTPYNQAVQWILNAASMPTN